MKKYLIKVKVRPKSSQREGDVYYLARDKIVHPLLTEKAVQMAFNKMSDAKKYMLEHNEIKQEKFMYYDYEIIEIEVK